MKRVSLNQNMTLFIIKFCGVDKLTWSDEAPKLKLFYNQQILSSGPGMEQRTLSYRFIYTYFKTLRFIQSRIRSIDFHSQQLVYLRELDLTGNELCHLPAEEWSYLPVGLQRLILNANELNVVPEIQHLTQLLHLGLSCNHIKSLEGAQLPPRLISLDLSSNPIEHLHPSVIEPLKQNKTPLQLLCIAVSSNNMSYSHF